MVEGVVQRPDVGRRGARQLAPGRGGGARGDRNERDEGAQTGRKEEPEPEPLTRSEELLTEIRDALAQPQP